MSDTKPQFLEIGNAAEKRKIAYLQQIGKSTDPGIIWLPGFHSTMESTKASALSHWCAHQQRSFTRFDYSGHGHSSGKPEHGTISQWLEEAAAILENCTSGPQILIGSSMGAWITLLLIRNLADKSCPISRKIHAAILIAPAWDMTEKLVGQKLDNDARYALETHGIYYAPSDYDDAPYPITRALIEDGRQHLIAVSPFNPGVPIRILHGLQDADVPWKNSLNLLDLLQIENAVLTLIKDGDHRLSRTEDIDRLFQEISALKKL